MTEETLNQENQQDDELFDDFNMEEETPIQNQNEVIPQDEALTGQELSEVKEQSDEPFLTIQYDKQDIPLSKDEAIVLSQKGKNYDRLFDKYSQLNGEIEHLASMNGMDVNTFINSLSDTQYRYEVSKELDNLKQQYPDTDEAVLQQLANEKVHTRLSELERNSRAQEQEQVDTQTLEIRRQLQLFKNEYPNLEPDKLDREVYDYVKSGYTLLEAYNKWANIQKEKSKPAIEEKEKVDKLNQSNILKSYGNMVNTGNVDSDDFMSGWNDE